MIERAFHACLVSDGASLMGRADEEAALIASDSLRTSAHPTCLGVM